MDSADDLSVENRIILLLTGLTHKELAKAVLAASVKMLDLEEDAATTGDANQIVAQMVVNEILDLKDRKGGGE